MNKKLVLKQFMQYMHDNWFYAQHGLWENKNRDLKNINQIIDLYLKEIE